MAQEPPPILRPDPGAPEHEMPRSRRFLIAVVLMFLPILIGGIYATWHDFGWSGLAVLGGSVGYLTLVFWLLKTAVDGAS